MVASLSERINSRASLLDWKFTEATEVQKLVINYNRPLLFSTSAGGQVAGGSAKWMRKKHNDGGIHEPGTIAVFEALQSNVGGIDTVFDIGALYGYFSLICAAVFPDAEIYSFEMNESSFRAMEQNVALNEKDLADRIHLLHCALSDVTYKKRRVLINDFAIRNLRETSLLDKCRNYFARTKGFTTSAIDCWTLDDFCRQHEVKPDLMKIDVEGGQAFILPGAMRVIEENRPIVLLEFDDQTAVNATGKSNKEVVDPLMASDYRIIIGNHRSQDPQFRELKSEELGSLYENDALAVLYPSEKFS
jgi:FkbM family methyltransferase